MGSRRAARLGRWARTAVAGGTGIDARHANGQTSLMLAPAHGRKDLVAWLIERSARAGLRGIDRPGSRHRAR